MIVVFRFAEGDRPRPLSVLGVLLGFAGLAVLVLVGGGSVGGFPVGPALLVMFASTCWAFGSYVQPRLWLPRDVFVTTVYEMLFGGLLLLTVGRLSGESFTAAAYSARTWSALGYLVVFGSVVAFTSYVWLLANAPSRSWPPTPTSTRWSRCSSAGWCSASTSPGRSWPEAGSWSAVALVISAERPRRRTAEDGDAPVPAAVAGEPGPVDEVCADDATRSRG